MSEPEASSFPRSFAAREAALLAPYAFPSAATRGRLHPEPLHPYRGPFQRDRDRIVHCAAFRRLGHKTQVFTGEPGDYHRSRLTHTMEVASVARTVGRSLGLNEDLIEALALLHDLGHPPFGHAGEATLADCLADDGGFDHNRHALRLVEELESRYESFPGLNLSHEVLDGQRFRVGKDSSAARPLLEVQVVDAADSIAYNAHDADDALELGLFTLAELQAVPLWREALARVQARHYPTNHQPPTTNHSPSINDLEATRRLRRAIVHELIDWQVSDLLSQAERRLGEPPVVSSNADVGGSPWIIRSSEELSAMKQELEAFLHQHVYRHPRVMAMRDLAQRSLAELFKRFVARPDDLPPRFRDRIAQVGLCRTVGDYLAGMTDRFALSQHAERC